MQGQLITHQKHVFVPYDCFLLTHTNFYHNVGSKTVQCTVTVGMKTITHGQELF